MPQSNTTQISAPTTLPSLLSTAQHIKLPPNSSHEPFLTNPSSPTPQSTNPYTLQPTPGPQLLHSTAMDLLPGDSNLPYPSLTLENITDPPSRVFREPAHSPNTDTNLKKILFWNDVSKYLVYLAIYTSTTYYI